MASDRPVVVVVGAGLAGLRCADKLTDVADVVLFEARDRVGGRCWSSHGWADGQVAEHGGELIEVGQDHVLRLVDELGLELEDRDPGNPAPGLALLGGQSLTMDELVGAGALFEELGRDRASIGPITADAASDKARAIDEMSVQEWLDERLGSETQSAFGIALATAIRLNLGFEPSSLSALSLHHMFLGFDDPAANVQGSDARAFAFGNETNPASESVDVEFGEVTRAAITQTLHVRGGNDLIATGLADRLPDGVLHLDSPVHAIRRVGGGYLVSAAGTADVRAQHVVLSNPLPTLRDVDLTAAGLSQRRLDAIASMGMGAGQKILLQLTARPETLSEWPGLAVVDNPAAAVWDNSAAQPGTSGMLTIFGQGSLPGRLSQPHGPLTPELEAYSRELLKRISPQVADHLAVDGWVDYWPDDPWAKGSYSGYAPGQYTRFSGFLAEPEGGIHFAGEHTSLASPGYLDGAIASGHRAAAEVREALGE